MSETLPACPQCSSEYTYEMPPLLVCPECGHEWTAGAEEAEGAEGAEAPKEIKDAVGNVLADGDDVTVIKDLKVKGAPKPIKSGTKVRGIRLVNGSDGHDIDCKVPGFGPMQLKSIYVKKAV